MLDLSLERCAALSAALLLGVPGRLAAQQYVWSVPSAEVAEKGSVQVELYSYWGPRSPQSLYLGPRFIIGAGHGVETGLNVSANVTPTSDSRLELPLKWQVWTSPSASWAFTVGATGYLRLHGTGFGDGWFGWSHLTRTFGSGAALSLGAGYYSSGVVEGESEQLGAMIAYVQPIGDRLTLAGDWVSGESGSATFGFWVAATPKLYFSSAYNIGNTGVSEGNHSLLLAVSWLPGARAR